MRVLFVCIGNSCRSPMAEGWANHLGLTSASCGTSGARSVAPHSVSVMEEKGIDIRGHTPRLTSEFDAKEWDLVISMGCGVDCTDFDVDRDWKIPDPVGRSLEEYRATRDNLEMRVRDLVAEAEAVE